jgi:DNA ligase (NAD+)
VKDFLDYASAKYYEGSPVITDAEFDHLAAQHNYKSVGYILDKGVAHTFPLYSLKKCFVGEPPIELPGEVIETPKLDGVAIALTYYGGKLVKALTRGDGGKGLDILDKAATFVPLFTIYTGLIQISGEVVAEKSIPNARNYASGALNLKSVNEFKTRKLRFIAYKIDGTNLLRYTETMGFLRDSGFDTVLDQSWDNYPQDGRVFRVNDEEAFKELGYTRNHPRGAFALKEIQEGVVTTLLDVVWQVGRSGVVSPVAILEPVKVGDATISRATLHNMKYIRELDLDIDCRVEIIRSGEIIPRVVRRVN